MSAGTPSSIPAAISGFVVEQLGRVRIAFQLSASADTYSVLLVFRMPQSELEVPPVVGSHATAKSEFTAAIEPGPIPRSGQLVATIRAEKNELIARNGASTSSPFAPEIVIFDDGIQIPPASPSIEENCAASKES
jgi:hypothetical protein